MIAKDNTSGQHVGTRIVPLSLFSGHMYNVCVLKVSRNVAKALFMLNGMDRGL